MKTIFASRLALSALLLLGLLLQACATRSPSSTPTICPPPKQIPALPPSLGAPLPQEDFLRDAETDIRSWESELRNSETRSPASRPSR